MMLPDLFRELARAGVTLYADADADADAAGLHVVGDTIPGRLLPHLRQHKPALLTMLADGRYDVAVRDAQAYEGWLAEPWGDPRWTDVDKLLALIDRLRLPVRVMRRGARR